MRPKALVIVTALVIALSWWQLFKGVPYNMDEFAVYHGLACGAAPLSAKYQHYREPCDDTLQIKGIAGFRILRS
jgi:hypothetical protein